MQCGVSVARHLDWEIPIQEMNQASRRTRVWRPHLRTALQLALLTFERALSSARCAFVCNQILLPI
jgi:hypothetical protein